MSATGLTPIRVANLQVNYNKTQLTDRYLTVRLAYLVERWNRAIWVQFLGGSGHVVVIDL